MELWFSDYHTEKVKVSVKVQKQLFGLQTEFQRIDVFDSDEFGRFLSADGSIVFSEKDEFIYDEMIVHVPMHPGSWMMRLPWISPKEKDISATMRHLLCWRAVPSTVMGKGQSW